MIPLRGLAHPSASLNIVFDGNSLVAGTGAAVATMPQRVLATAPIASSGATVTNLGIGGQTTRMMNGLDGGSSADVDGAWVAGKYNILVIWEATNSITVGGRTAQQTFDDCVAYIAARKAVHPWRIILLTTLPRSNAGVDPQLRVWNANVIANFRAMGVDVVVDVRHPGSVFNFAGETSDGFVYTQSYWFETTAWVHLNDKGYQLVAEWVCAAIRRITKRLPS